MKIVINPAFVPLCARDRKTSISWCACNQARTPGFRAYSSIVALVLDRSGSMQGPKLREAKRCVEDLVSRMDPSDKVGLVQYDDQRRYGSVHLRYR
jgi:hypothetical protein